jgi:hypothetical protein
VIADDAILRTARRLERIAYKLPAAEAEIERKVDAVDGWPERGESVGRHGTPGVDSNTATEAAALARLKHSLVLQHVYDQLGAIDDLASLCERECDRITNYTVHMPLCNGGEGQRGAETWGAPGRCAARPERPGLTLCTRHRKKKNRWQAENPEA